MSEQFRLSSSGSESVPRDLHVGPGESAGNTSDGGRSPQPRHNVGVLDVGEPEERRRIAGYLWFLARAGEFASVGVADDVYAMLDDLFFGLLWEGNVTPAPDSADLPWLTTVVFVDEKEAKQVVAAFKAVFALIDDVGPVATDQEFLGSGRWAEVATLSSLAWRTMAARGDIA